MPNVKIDPNDIAIRLKGLKKSFGPQTVLEDVNLDIRRGETMVIIGKSGGGKSVILKHMIGLLQPDGGEVTVDGVTISTPQFFDTRTIRRKMGMLFQMGALVVTEKLQMINLVPSFRTKMPSELSGGMRKRVALARAIALNPEILLYDEPTTGLDPITSDVINDLILDMQSKLGVTSVVVTHDMVSAFKVADRIAMLLNGRIIEVGTVDEIKNTSNPYVHQFITGQRKISVDGESQE